MIAGINALVDLQQAIVQRLDLPILAEKKCVLDVLRIDKIHAIISGNKWFKLKYNLKHALSLNNNTIVTCGGAYSNHLVATAFACYHLQLKSIGIVRGERPETFSPTLEACADLGMELQFVSREQYHTIRNAKETPVNLKPGQFFIEEGGANALGIEGASDIASCVAIHQYSNICCALGTGTMMAGLVNSASEQQHLNGIPVLKLQPGNSVERFISGSTDHKNNYSIHYGYHFGGYARKTETLVNFMNDFFRETGVPTDFVYTAKLFYGLIDLLRNNHFPAGSHLLAIHSGGLQGNRSLPKNTLIF